MLLHRIIIIAAAAILFFGLYHYQTINMPLTHKVIPPAARTLTAPFYLTPHVQGLNLLDKAATARLIALLDTLEPGGPAGNVQVGYTLTLDIYDYYIQQDQGWRFDSNKLRQLLSSARKVNRPVAIYLAANHFFSSSPYAQYLLTLPESSMHYADGSAPNEIYFETQLAPFRISNDISLPHIRAKFDALTIIAAALPVIDDMTVAVMLNGETHFMFSDFFSGTGNYTNPQMTDYRLTEEKQAFSPYASGYFPVYGWYCHDNPVDVYVNGKHYDKATTQLGRLDVYEAIAQQQNANCGVRAILDVSDWEDGDYAIQLVATEDGDAHQLPNGNLTLTIGERGSIHAQSRPLPMSNHGWTDSTDTHLTYNPAARLWMQRRSNIISDHITTMSDIVQRNGIDASKLYSYQLAPWMNADWNTELFGISHNFFLAESMRPGITLYGGATMNDRIFTYLPDATPYGIPEFHPQMGKDSHYALHALRYHYHHNAAFLSPYFMNINPHTPKDTSHNTMMITPDNAAKGSDALYHAIIALAKE